MQQKERATSLHDSIDGTGEHYAEWNKPGGEDKYHMTSPISGTLSTTQASNQNGTRDIEIKDKWQ